MYSPANVNKQDVHRGKKHEYPVKHTWISTQFIHMYVRMYVCMYICTYVCIYVCMYVCTYMYVKHQQALMWVHKNVKGTCAYIHTYVHMYIRMYVNDCILLSSVETVHSDTLQLEPIPFIHMGYQHEVCPTTILLTPHHSGYIHYTV